MKSVSFFEIIFYFSFYFVSPLIVLYALEKMFPPDDFV